MPVVRITTGPTDKDMKKAIIENVTKTLSETTEIPVQGFTVIIDEKDHDSIGIGGETLTEKFKK